MHIFSMVHDKTAHKDGKRLIWDLNDIEASEKIKHILNNFFFKKNV